MTVLELCKAIDGFCPRPLSCSWDNDGMMSCPDPNAKVMRVLLSLDATRETIEYAVQNGCDTVVTHHPMLFKGAKSVSPLSLPGRRIVKSVKNGVSVLSFHTRLDRCDGGVNDALLGRLGFLPSEKFGDEETPDICRAALIDWMTAGELAELVKERLGCDMVRLNGRTKKKVGKIGVCGGDGKDFVYPALYSGCDAFITGDAGYNTAGDAWEEGIVTIEAGHYHTEAPVLDVLERLIHDADNEIEILRFNSCTYRII